MKARTLQSTAPDSPPVSTGAWPVWFWASQLLVTLPIVSAGVYRLFADRPLGALILTAASASLVWTIVVVAVLATGTGRRWLVAHRMQLVLCAASATLSLLFLGEVGVRLLAQRDQDDNWYFRGHHLKPYRLPVEKVARFARQLEKDKTVVIPDKDLGWVPRPGFAGGQAIQDQNGLRAATTERAVDRVPAATNYRIALFGDSFTYGAEVAYADSWCAYLEQQLVLPGFHTEVLNFGVSGYGMDQAYLRWKRQGIEFAPQLVVFGLQFENVQRNTNLVRAIYNPRTGLPFAKPRFVLEDDQLSLVNHPCVAPQDLPEVLRSFEQWPWSQHEAHYRVDDYRSHWWQASRLLAFVQSIIGETLLAEESDYQADSDDARLCIKIIENFAESVESAGAQFVVLVMPKRKDLEYAMVHDEFPYEAILAAAARPLNVVRADQQLLKAARTGTPDKLYLRLHYSPKGNQIVAKALVDQLETMSLTKTPLTMNAKLISPQSD